MINLGKLNNAMKKIPIGITEIVEDQEGFYTSSIHILFRDSEKDLWQHKCWEIHGMTKKETNENIENELLALRKEIKIRTNESPDIEFQMIPQIVKKYIVV